MLKRDFKKIMEQVEFYQPNYFAVIVDLGNDKYELIVNAISNFESKYKYYLEAYDDNMVHINAPIKIADVVAADNINIISDSYSAYIENK